MDASPACPSTRYWHAVALNFAALNILEILVGKGDRRTRRGKIYAGSFGKLRPKDPKAGKKPAARAAAKPAAAKPAARPAAKRAKA
jgi:30S ribosomal protein S31